MPDARQPGAGASSRTRSAARRAAAPSVWWRAKACQSIFLASSPTTYSRRSANSSPLARASLRWPPWSPLAERGLTLIGFAVSNIDRDGAQQLELPFGPGPDLLAVDRAVDEVRERFGNSALTRGVLVGRDGGLEMPMLPD